MQARRLDVPTISKSKPERRPTRWEFRAPNGWRHERVTTHRPPPSTNWAWKPPKKPRVSRAQLEAQRQRDREQLERAWNAMTGAAT
jgi:hypothetical protein